MNLGPAELLVIILFAFIIVGPERLPKAAKAIGKALRKLRDTRGSIDQTLKDEGLDPESLQEASRNPFLALEKIEKIASVLPTEELTGEENSSEEIPPENGSPAADEPGIEAGTPDGESGDGEGEPPRVTALSDIETFTERKARIAAAASTEPEGDSGEEAADGDDPADGHE